MLGAYPPVAIDELSEFIERSRANDQLRFSQEYESIDPGEFASWECSNAECNRNKNRYANVVAYDHSRVILEVLQYYEFEVHSYSSTHIRSNEVATNYPYA